MLNAASFLGALEIASHTCSLALMAQTIQTSARRQKTLSPKAAAQLKEMLCLCWYQQIRHSLRRQYHMPPSATCTPQLAVSRTELLLSHQLRMTRKLQTSSNLSFPLFPHTSLLSPTGTGGCLPTIRRGLGADSSQSLPISTMGLGGIPTRRATASAASNADIAAL